MAAPIGSGAKGKGVQAARLSYGLAGSSEAKQDLVDQGNTGIIRQPGESEQDYSARVAEWTRENNAATAAYNQAQPDFWQHLEQGGLNALPIGIGAAAGPGGMILGGLRSAQQVSNQVAQENALNNNALATGGAQAETASKAAGTYVQPRPPTPTEVATQQAQQQAAAGGTAVARGALGAGFASNPIDTGGINGAADYSRQLADQYNQAYGNFQPKTAKGVTAGVVGPTALAATGAPVQAGTFAGAQLSPTALAARQAAIQAGTYGGATLAPTTLAQQQAAILAQQINASQIGKTNLADQTAVNLGPQAEFRTGEQGLISGLNGTIAGTDPSVAAIMLRQATDRNIANQYALAQAANGQGAGIASYNAARNVADLNQQAAIQQALLRAQEIATARGQLGSALDQARTGDIGLATTQANLTQGTNLANSSALNTTAQQNATLAQQAAVANAANSLAAGTTNATLAQGVNLANANNANQNTQLQGQLANAAGIANAGNVTQANTATGQLANAIAIANANNQNQNIQQQGSLTNAAGIANAGNITQANTSTAQLANAVNIANAGNQNQNQQTQATLNTTASNNNASNDIQQQQANEIARQNAAANALTASGQVITGRVGAADAQAKVAQANAQRDAALIGAVATGGAALLSSGKGATVAVPGTAPGPTAPSVNIPGGGGTASNSSSSSTAGADNSYEPEPTPNDSVNPDSGYGPNDDVSDRRQKKDIHGADPDMDKFLTDLSRSGAYKFRYKDDTAPGTAPGDRWGVMAQDLEKNRVGASLVRDTPGGKKVDGGQAALVALAALAALNKRVDRVEGGRR